MQNEKARITLAPILVAGAHLDGWKPVVISRTKGTKWKDIIKVEKKKFKKYDEEIEIERRIFPNCVLVYTATQLLHNCVLVYTATQLLYSVIIFCTYSLRE